MVCIYCGSKTEITNSRDLKRNNSKWRRRRCIDCRQIVTTFEHPDYTNSWLVSDAESQYKPFLRDRLYLSVYDCLKHRKSAAEEAGSLTDTIISKLASKTSASQIDKELLTDIALNCLKHFDSVAAVHYNAYYIK